MVATSLTIEPRFRGPPDSGNGGYVAGLVAAPFGHSDCVVTLRRPPPLGVSLRLDSDAHHAALSDDNGLIASGDAGPVLIDVPAPPTAAGAAAASAHFAGFAAHIFPACFVCGPERAAGDGLRIFAGRPGTGDGQVAALWTPDAGFADDAGEVRPVFVWAALDCPGYFAVAARSGPAVLGRIGVRRHHPVMSGTTIVVTGWPIASDGRKHRAGTALHDETGRLLAAATATWISISA